MRVEQRSRNRGKQTSLTHATRIVTDVRDDSRLITAELGVCLSSQLFDCYRFVHFVPFVILLYGLTTTAGIF